MPRRNRSARASEFDSPISPVIDTVMNGMAAMFFFIVILTMLVGAGAAPLKLPSTTLPAAIAGLPFFCDLPIDNGTRFTITQGTLPDGLRIDQATGTIYGTAKPCGLDTEHAITVQVRDMFGQQDTRDMVLRVRPSAFPFNAEETQVRIARGGDLLPAGRVGAAYAHQLWASGGIGRISWYANGGLPPGITLTDDGALVGTPEAAGPYTFTVSVAYQPGEGEIEGKPFNWQGGTDIATFSMKVLPLHKTVAVLESARVDEGFQSQLCLTPLLPHEVVEIAGLPEGLVSDPFGSISGIPRIDGTFPLVYRILAGGQVVDDGACTLHVRKVRDLRQVEHVHHVKRGESVAIQIPYRDLDEPVTMTTATPLPPDFRLEDGMVVGVATTIQLAQFTINIEDADGRTTSSKVSIRVVPEWQ
jgi:hypothetical protein